MKLLIICGVFPPSTSATAVLINKLLLKFNEARVQVDGVTFKRSLADPDSYQTGNIKVYCSNGILGVPSEVKCFADFKYKAVNHLHRRFSKPTGVVPLYKRDRVKALMSTLKKLKVEEYDGIISICAYYDAAVALAEYKKKYSLKTPIVLYQVDPLTENVIYGGGEALLAYEKSLYGLYDYVFTTPTVYETKKGLGWDMSNVEVLMFPMSFGDRKTFKREDREIIKCVYTGQLYGDIRDARPTLELFSSIADPKIHLYFAGRGQEALLREYEQGKLKGRLHLLGEKTAEECDELLADADILINIGNTDKYLIPSKLFHYFGFGKPILNISKDSSCPALPYINEYGLGLSVLEQELAGCSQPDKVKNWIYDNKDESVDEKEIRKNFYSSDPKYIAEHILSVLKQKCK